MDAAGITGEPVCRYRLPSEPAATVPDACPRFAATLAGVYESRGYPATAATVRQMAAQSDNNQDERHAHGKETNG